MSIFHYFGGFGLPTEHDEAHLRLYNTCVLVQLRRNCLREWYMLIKNAQLFPVSMCYSFSQEGKLSPPGGSTEAK
jgi:hypothetical protein